LKELARCWLAPLFCLVGILAPASRATAQEPEPLVWAADAEGGAPYIFKDPQNPSRNIGFEVDLAEALSRELGRPIIHRQYAFEGLVPGLLRGDFDFAMNGLEVTPDRRATILFSRPYYIYQQQLVVRAEETRIENFEQLKTLDDVLVATLGDTAAERLLDEFGIPKRRYDNQTDPYLDLELGRVDAVFLDLPIAVAYGKSNPKLKFVGPPVQPGFYAIGFRPQDQQLAAQVDAALEKLISSGELQKIYEKWGIWDETQRQLASASLDDVAASRSGLSFSRYFPLLLEGALTTIVLSVLSMLLAIAIGLQIAVMRLYGPAPVRWLATAYVEFFRGIPVLLLLFFLYYSLPGIAQYYGLSVSLQLPAFYAAILGFGLNYAAYEAEIYRAGISSIPAGQWEAAASLGMTGPQTFRRIVLPQAVRFIIPPMTNDFVALFKDTSLVSIIAVTELTKQYQILARSSMKYLELGLVTAALYLVMSVPLGYLSRYLEHRWSKDAHD